MKIVSPIILFIFFSISVNSQEVLGVWKTKDRKTGEERALVEIYLEQNKIHAKIIKALNHSIKDFNCLKCKGKNKGKPLVGMIILKDLKRSQSEYIYKNGLALNPINGKFYSCDLKLINSKILRVRGYLGISLFGKSEYWQRVE